MAWSIIGYPMSAAAPVQNSATITADTPAQQAGQALWITASAASTITITLPSGSTLPATLASGLTILPVAATNYTVNSGTITSAYNVWTTS